jgi:hypothetical protein
MPPGIEAQALSQFKWWRRVLGDTTYAGADKFGHAWATVASRGTELLSQWGGFDA